MRCRSLVGWRAEQDPVLDIVCPFVALSPPAVSSFFRTASYPLTTPFGATLQDRTCHRTSRQHTGVCGHDTHQRPHTNMSSRATDGSGHGSGPSRGGSPVDGVTSPYSTDPNESYAHMGSQFSDPQNQYVQQRHAGRPERTETYERHGYAERYDRPQQPKRSDDVARNDYQQQRRLDREYQAAEDRRRLEAQRLHAERLRQEHYRQEQRRQEQRRQEQRRQELLRQELLRQEQLRQEHLRQERLRQERIRQEHLLREAERRRYDERLTTQETQDRERHRQRDPRGEDESRQSRRRRPR
jgi:hypothetical protein